MPDLNVNHNPLITNIYVAVDTETLGLDIYKHGICQVGGWATGDSFDHHYGYFVKDGNPTVDSQYTGVEIDDPFTFVDDGALKVNGFTQQRISQADAFVQTLREFNAWLTKLENPVKSDGIHEQKVTLVFHNASFDVARLMFAMQQYGIEPSRAFRRVLCTISLGFSVFGEVLSLEKLAGRLGIVNHAAHDALADAVTTSRVFHELRKYELQQGQPF